jgi:hypothetical protein
MSERLQERVDAAVIAVLEERRDEVERLISAAVDRELALLVDQLVERALGRAWTTNGSAESTSASPAEKVCVECGKAPRTQWRSRCRSCQSRREGEQRRARKAAAANGADGQEPHPPPPAPSAAHPPAPVGAAPVTEASRALA